MTATATHPGLTPTAAARMPRHDRETTARRLLASAAKTSYDQQKDIDWTEPLEEGLFGLTPEWSSLYGTDLWDRMSEEQRVRLTELEFCSISGVGIWFEMILMQMVIRDIYDQDPATKHVQFALTEIADECRHSVMFAMTAEKFGAPSYQPTGASQELGRLFKTLAKGPDLYASILVAEEVLDIFQREVIEDERVQPLTRAVSRIHVVEEARHMRFARDEIARRAASMSTRERILQRSILSIVANVIIHNLVQPEVYAAAGLDVKEATRAARANEHYTAKLTHAAAGLTSFLEDVGLIGGPSKRLWTRARMI